MVQEWNEKLPRGALAYVAIHGRSRQARYTARADWGYIQQCCANATAKAERAAAAAAAPGEAAAAASASDGRFKPIPVIGKPVYSITAALLHN